MRKSESILDRIVAVNREELHETKRKFPLSELRARLQDLEPPRRFLEALKDGSQGTRIIAEVKKASPTKGLIRADFDPVAIATTYEEHGAAAISILTEKQFFQGNLDYLHQIRKVTHIPLLRKDFLFEEYQIYQSRIFGADALLLIVAMLEKGELKELFQLTHEVGLEALVEVHNEDELDTALSVNARLIGINNRDLKTFQTTLDTTLRLVPLVPPGKVIVSESGINHRSDIELLEKAGVHAFLIGEALMRERDIGKKMRELL
ncbi:MAG: indole-3-glycerol phosphate synthase TrpC [Candidatus Tectomicrobia bacterium]|nr:indole-3-glycerol phosphate synthase TrpC [Candidatus Tectomicrobia bacterium]